MLQHLVRAFLVAAILTSPAAQARGHGHPHHAPRTEQAHGAASAHFDYYVLALSWSPTYCLTHANDVKQCGTKGMGFVLHGLWPEFSSGGYPQDCATDQRLTGDARNFARTIYPSPKLIDHEWNKHGTCSGLDAMAYFKAADDARTRIRIPSALDAPARTRSMTVDEIKSAFISANPGMSEDALVVACSGPELAEVRFCLNRNLSPGGCGRGVVSSCRHGPIRIPAVH